MATGFVGRDREAAVQALQDLFNIGIAGGPKTVLITAPAGWGKTYIVQEFYARLASRQRAEYWPQAMTVGTAKPVLHRRKRSYPETTPPRDAALPWMWWGLNAHRETDGTFQRVIRADDPQWFVHARALDERLPTAWRSLSVSKAVGKRVPVVAGVLGCFILPVGIASAAFGGLAELWQDAREWVERREGGDGALGIRPARPETLAKAIASLSRRLGLKTPIIIFVEDAHYLDSESLTALRLLREDPKASILTVLAAQSDVLSRQRADEVPGLACALDTDEFPVDLKINLDPLTADELSDSVAKRFPATDTRVARALGRRFAPNPLALEIALEAPALRASAQKDAVDVTVADVAQLPTSIKDLYWTKWMEIEEETRVVLAVASLVGPVFATETVIDACRGHFNVDAKAAIIRAETAHEWLRPYMGGAASTVMFTEETTFDIAVEAVPTVMTAKTSALVLTRCADLLQEEIADGRAVIDEPAEATSNLARGVLRAATTGVVTLPAIHIADAAAVIAATMFPSPESARLYELQAEMAQRGGSATEAVAEALRRAASSCMEAEPERAVLLANRAWESLPEASRSGVIGRDVLETLGMSCSLVGDLNVGLAHLERCLVMWRYSERTDRNENTSRTIERVLSNLAGRLLNVGDYNAALELNSEAYERRRDRLGDTSLMTLVSLRNVARSHSHLDNRLQAIQCLMRVRDGFEASLGPADEETIEAEAELARALWAMNCVDDALTRLQRAASLADVELGRSSIVALKTHLSLGEYFQVSGDAEPASTELHYVLRQASEVATGTGFLMAGALAALGLLEVSRGNETAGLSQLDQAAATWLKHEGPAGTNFLRIRAMRAGIAASDEERCKAALRDIRADLSEARRVRPSSDPAVVALEIEETALLAVVEPATFNARGPGFLQSLEARGRSGELITALSRFGQCALLAKNPALAHEFLRQAHAAAVTAYGASSRRAADMLRMCDAVGQLVD